MTVFELSFDPRDPLLDAPGAPGVRWGLQVFTTHNVYALDPAQTTIDSSDDGIRLRCDGLRWGGQQQTSPGQVSAYVSTREGALCWQVEAWHAEPIKSIKLMLWGLPEGPLASGWWQPTSSQDETTIPTAREPLRWRYPWPEWLTAWACASDGAEGVCVSIRDGDVRAKRLYVHQPGYSDGKYVVELLCDQDAARLDGHFAAPEMRLRLCNGQEEIESDFAAHLAAVEMVYRLPRWETRPDAPAWLHKTRLVVNLHGQHWTGYVFNTFDRMAHALHFITRHIPGEQVMAFLPGWEGRYYYSYPNYQPGAAMGGSDGFRRLLDVARDLGVHAMPMFGMHGANTFRYPDWQDAAFRNPLDTYVQLVNRPDWDGDRLGEDNQVFLNPGEPGYRQHLLEQVSGTVGEYGLDAVFLDTSGCWFNDPRHNLVAGYRALVDELHSRHPSLLVGGEGWFDAMLGIFPINQSWLGVERHYRFPQMLTRYSRALGHLADGTPATGSSGVHEAGYQPRPPQRPTPGHIPSLGIVGDTLSRYGDEVAAICRAATTEV